MTTRKKLVIFLLVVAGATIPLVIMAAVIYKFVLSPYFTMQEVPPELREVKVIIGADVLTKSEFYRVGKESSASEMLDPDKLKSSFDSVSELAVGQLDGKPGLDVAVVGSFGMTLLDRQGNTRERINYRFEKGKFALGPIETEREKNSFSNRRVIDVEGDGVCEILGYDGIDGVALFSHQGQVLFNRGEYKKEESSISEVAAGDIDGDGVLEFVASWGYEQWSGIELFDRYGNSKWRHREEVTPGPLEVVDVNGDGKAELVEADSNGLKIRDRQGKVTSSVKMPVYLAHLSLCSKPGDQRPPQNLAVSEGSLWLMDLDGKNFSKFDAPLSKIKLEKPREVRIPGSSIPFVFDNEEVHRARGVWVKLKSDQPEYLAVIAKFGVIDRSLFYLYDEKGKLVYQEILPEKCNAVVMLPPENEGGVQEVLISGEKTVWRYTAR